MPPFPGGPFMARLSKRLGHPKGILFFRFLSSSKDKPNYGLTHLVTFLNDFTREENSAEQSETPQHPKLIIGQDCGSPRRLPGPSRSLAVLAATGFSAQLSVQCWQDLRAPFGNNDLAIWMESHKSSHPLCSVTPLWECVPRKQLSGSP